MLERSVTAQSEAYSKNYAEIEPMHAAAEQATAQRALFSR